LGASYGIGTFLCANNSALCLLMFGEWQQFIKKQKEPKVSKNLKAKVKRAKQKETVTKKDLGSYYLNFCFLPV
jgi:hypothetical protein